MEEAPAGESISAGTSMARRAAIFGRAKHSANALFLCTFTIPLYLPCPSQSCAHFLPTSHRPHTHYPPSSTLRPPPNIDFVQGTYIFRTA